MTPRTLLLRQINPSFVQQGQVTSQAFRPMPKDDGFLSTYDGDKIEPRAAWAHFTAIADCRSSGVMASSHSEFAAHNLAIIPDGKDFPEHVSIDFNSCSKKEIEQIAKILKRQAVERGWLHPVSEGAID